MVVLADGCFDPIHVGHIRYLKAALAFGTLLIHVAPDAAIRAKGRPPFQTRLERIETLRTFNGVGGVIAEDSLAAAIQKWRPTYLCKGREWEGRLPEDVVRACEATLTRVIYTDTEARRSSERLTG